MFKGSITALITPFRGGEVDVQAFTALIEWQIGEGTNGLVPCGTTGESPTLSHEEHNLVVEVCVKAANGRVPVIAGTGSNSTDEAIMLTRHAREVGADAALLITPYYNKPTQEGMYRHFKAVHDAADLPLIIYNIPGRSVVDMSVATMARLAELPNIIGVKDATNDLTRPLRTRLAIGPNFCQLSGEDATVVPFISQGGVGCISVTANIAPKLCAALQGAWAARDLDEVMRLNEKLLPVHDAMFVETNPAPVKYAASLMGLCTADVRLPLCEVTDASKARIKSALTEAGLLT